MPGGSSDITIVASYRVHVLKLLGVDFEFQFEQCAKTKAWIRQKQQLVHPTKSRIQKE